MGASGRPGEDVVGFGGRGGATAAQGERPAVSCRCWLEAMVMDTALLTLKSLQLLGQKTRAFSNKKTLFIGKVPQAPWVNARESYEEVCLGYVWLEVLVVATGHVIVSSQNRMFSAMLLLCRPWLLQRLTLAPVLGALHQTKKLLWARS